MMAAYSIKILDQLFNNFMGKDYFRHAALLIVFCAISAFAFAQPKPSIKPIDPELIAKKFKRGIFKEILQNLAISLIGAAQSWHAHRHEAKQP